MSSWEEDHSWMIDAYESEIDTFYSNEPVWETADHKLIPVSQMSTNHIINCINLIKSRDFRPHFLKIFEQELKLRKNG